MIIYSFQHIFYQRLSQARVKVGGSSNSQLFCLQLFLTCMFYHLLWKCSNFTELMIDHVCIVCLWNNLVCSFCGLSSTLLCNFKMQKIIWFRMGWHWLLKHFKRQHSSTILFLVKKTITFFGPKINSDSTVLKIFSLKIKTSEKSISGCLCLKFYMIV